MRRYLVPFGVLALIGALGCGMGESASVKEAAPAAEGSATPGGDQAEPSAPSGELMNMAVGKTLSIKYVKGTVEVTVTKVTARKKGCGDYYKPTPTNGLFIDVEATAKVVEGTGDLNPLSFTHVAPDGTTGQWASSGCGPEMTSGNDLPAGSIRKGLITFDAKVKAGRIEYSSGFGSTLDGAWKIG